MEKNLFFRVYSDIYKLQNTAEKALKMKRQITKIDAWKYSIEAKVSDNIYSSTATASYKAESRNLRN